MGEVLLWLNNPTATWNINSLPMYPLQTASPLPPPPKSETVHSTGMTWVQKSYSNYESKTAKISQHTFHMHHGYWHNYNNLTITWNIFSLQMSPVQTPPPTQIRNHSIMVPCWVSFHSNKGLRCKILQTAPCLNPLTLFNYDINVQVNEVYYLLLVPNPQEECIL